MALHPSVCITSVGCTNKGPAQGGFIKTRYNIKKRKAL